MMIYIFLCTIKFVVKLYTYSLYLLDYEIAKFRKYDREKKNYYTHLSINNTKYK